MSDEFKEFDVTPTLTFGVEEEKPVERTGKTDGSKYD